MTEASGYAGDLATRSGSGCEAATSAGPARPGQERCRGLSLRAASAGVGAGRGAGGAGQPGSGPAALGGLERLESGAAGGAGARGRVGGAPLRAARLGPGAVCRGPQGISSRLHAATRVGLGSARQKQRPGLAGEAAGRARGGGAGGPGKGWGRLGWPLTWGPGKARRGLDEKGKAVAL